ncbi:hypothetical protein Tco_0351419 [Tanacetum coccineum]
MKAHQWLITARQGMIQDQGMKAADLGMKAVGQRMDAVQEETLGMKRISELPITQSQWLRDQTFILKRSIFQDGRPEHHKGRIHRLEEEKARKHGKVFNWETAKYGKIWCDEDVLDLRSVETEFPAIVFNDNLTSNETPSFPFNIVYPDDLKSDKGNDDNKIDMIQSSGDMALPPRDQRHQYLRYEGLQYFDADIADFETRLARIYMREIHRVQVFDFGGLPDLMAKGLSTRMLMEHRDAQGQSLERLYLIWTHLELYTFSWVERRETDPRQRGYEGLLDWDSSAGDFLGTAPSYTFIRDPMLGVCHRLIACSIARRSQAPEKVTVTDLFYLREMDVGSVNAPYLLARYLRLFTSGRKQRAMIFGDQYVARWGKHFGLLTEEGLQGLTIISPALPIIDMAELVRLQLCVQLDDTWAPVAPRDGDEDEEMPQAVLPPPRTQGERIA